jgi:prepilin-type processing-associated H-X9-DG protein
VTNMNDQCRDRRTDGFTFVEFLIVVALVAGLALVLVPGGIKAKQKAQRIRCTSFLMQSGAAFAQWAMDNTNLCPMQVSAKFGGTKEFIASGETFRHFEMLSNYLVTPLILACPADKGRIAARSFSPGINNSNLSYFVSLDADETQPQMFLSGDRTIFNGVRPRDGVVNLTTNNFTGWSADIHGGSINVSLADGSVQGISSNRLYQILAKSATNAFRLQLP